MAMTQTACPSGREARVCVRQVLPLAAYMAITRLMSKDSGRGLGSETLINVMQLLPWKGFKTFVNATCRIVAQKLRPCFHEVMRATKRQHQSARLLISYRCGRGSSTNSRTTPRLSASLRRNEQTQPGQKSLSPEIVAGTNSTRTPVCCPGNEATTPREYDRCWLFADWFKR